MTSSPTQSLPTHSPRLDALWRAISPSAWALALSSLALVAHAHDESVAVPEEPGMRLGAALALANVNASQALPSQRLSGYLLRGDSGVDRRASSLEHGVLEAGWRLNAQWSAYAAVGKHDNDPAHTEAAWVRRVWMRDDGASLSAQAGRMRPQMGPVMTQAGHLDRFALSPLARRVTLDGDWMDDGLQLSAHREWADWTGHADVGLWREQIFPGSAGASAAPSLHLGASRGDWHGDLFALALQPQGRGAMTQSASGAHTHNTPDCSTVKTGILCFAGRSQVLGSSAQWQSHDWPVTVQGAYMLRRDDGTLRSVNGQADHSATYGAGWLQALWQMRPDWEMGARSERLRARASLNGAGASLLAQEASLSGSAPVRRDTAMLSWQVHPRVALSAEAGRETQGSQRVNFAVLRAVMRTDAVWAR